MEVDDRSVMEIQLRVGDDDQMVMKIVAAVATPVRQCSFGRQATAFATETGTSSSCINVYAVDGPNRIRPNIRLAGLAVTAAMMIIGDASDYDYARLVFSSVLVVGWSRGASVRLRSFGVGARFIIDKRLIDNYPVYGRRSAASPLNLRVGDGDAHSGWRRKMKLISGGH